MRAEYPDFSIPDRVISSKWMYSILELSRRPRRFGELQAGLDGISRSVLAVQLRELLELGLLLQNNHHSFPPCVEYRLSEKGKRLLEILEQLKNLA